MGKQKTNFIPRPDHYPQIYVYEDNRELGKLKVGYTTKENPLDRIKEQYGATVSSKEAPYKLLWKTEAIKEDGTHFTDKAIHRVLKEKGFENYHEWFTCSLEDVKSAVLTIKKGIENEEKRSEDFKMRPEQQQAVQQTVSYFKKSKQQSPHSIPRFLWNAKMRFGKTFTTYQLANAMDWSKVLILTFKPAVGDAWKTDLITHIDFEGWKFHSLKSNQELPAFENKLVCFGSLQDVLGKTEGKIKEKNRWLYNVQWDCVVFDEYHFGAWRENTSDLFDGNTKELEASIKTNHFLYLSGTPFRAIQSGEFIEEQIFNWTYADEQRAKLNWNSSNGDNPYESLPQLTLLTYRLPNEIREVASKTNFNEFDLNAFFKAEGEGDSAKFKNECEVQKWLDLIRGRFQETSTDQLELRGKEDKPPLPFEDPTLLPLLTHTLWYLPNVSACYAMRNLMNQRHNQFYQDYQILVAAGNESGTGEKALIPVKQAIKDGLKTKTIVLTCGKLTTGVTVEPWTGIFMLRNLSKPESYFQAAFRVQSPWVVPGEQDEKIIMKKQCFIFDFAPDRALSQLATYCDRLNSSDISQEKKIQEFINFLPVLAYDGFVMEQVDAAGLLDVAMGRMTATLLAKGWNNAMLINLSTDVLKELINNEQAMNALMSIEGFRNAKEDIGVIISKSNVIQKLKTKEENGEKLNSKEKKKLSDEEKAYKKKRLEVLDKLKIFATRIPLFMYLTDEREETLKQVITKLEPKLFKRVTGLTVKDFELLVSLGIFQENLMNNLVLNFRKYEDASMEYTGINRHEGNPVGLFNTSVSKDEYEEGFR